MKKIAAMILGIVSVFFLFLPAASAHELYIQVDEQDNELRIDVLWGHIRDYVSDANKKDYQLYVRDPDGDTQELDMENVGVHSRAYVPLSSEGTYTFWAVRKPGTHEPEEGMTQLTNQYAKTIYYTGSGTTNIEEPAEMNLEIVPDGESDHFTTGQFEGKALFNGEPNTDIVLTAYGPEGEVLNTAPDKEGNFSFPFDTHGKWLIKGNIVFAEEGSINDIGYEEAGYTSTLLVDLQEDELPAYNVWSLFTAAIAGIFIGASFILLLIKKK